MMQWVKPGTRRACIFGMLLAVLAGCNNGGDEKQDSTFDTVQADDSKLPNEPAVGTVKVIPGTQHEPKTGGGEAIPLGDKKDEATLLNEGVKPAPEKVTRFTEIAPDTAGGATFRSSGVIDYDLGKLVAKVNSYTTADKTLVTPMKGWARYPQEGASPLAQKTYPVIVFLHGNHEDTETEHSYQGYDYLAEDLAAHGYAVLSIDATAINKEKLTEIGSFVGVTGGGDKASLARGQLILGTLDRLRQINENGQVDKQGNPGPLNQLKGKLDFSRIGIMGHSRGGQGVSNAILFNQNRRGVTQEDVIAAVRDGLFSDAPDLVTAASAPDFDEAAFQAAMVNNNVFRAAGGGNGAPVYTFKGAFMLAPTDNGNNTGLDNVPLANLLPSCDGDVDDLQGARVYDHNRFGPANDTAPRYQIMVKGANHNYYNRSWKLDDSGEDAYCAADRTDTIRLTDLDQRRGGSFIINSFMRYHVGGEPKFAPWWNAAAQLPGIACPAGAGPCDERVVLTVQKNAGDTAEEKSRYRLIHRFDQASSTELNALGGSVTFAGFDATARCNMVSNCPSRMEGFEDWRGFLTVADHVELSWSQPGASITETLVTPPAANTSIKQPANFSAAGHDYLTFRIAVVQPMGQEVEVTLTDGVKTATVTASKFSDALYNAPRRKKGGDLPDDKDLPMVDDPADADYAKGQAKILLNMVAIPLKAFEGVDMTNLKELKLSFPKESGKVAIADIELQNFGRDKPAVTVAAKQ